MIRSRRGADAAEADETHDPDAGSAPTPGTDEGSGDAAPTHRPRRSPRRGRRPPPQPDRPLTDDVVALASGAWTQAVTFAFLAAAVVTSSAQGRYVGENRFDQYFAPGHRLVRSLFLWDPTRGLGATREDLWPIEVAPLAVLRGLGLDAVATQRVWHVVLLTVAATGAAAALRTVRGRTGSPPTALGPFLAGLIYGFGAYSHTYFLPTNLYVAYAAAPWVVVCALRGAVSRHPWRTAGAAALIVGSLGNTDIPGVVMALLLVPAAAIWSSSNAGRGWRPGLRWLLRAGGLGLLVSADALYKTWAGASVLAQRLGSTESPETVAVASSWSESLRGLGFWLSYYRGPTLARPQGLALFADPWVVAATFVPVLLALVALLLPEVRSRALWGLGLVGAAVVMVGLHPVDDSVPLGDFLADAFAASPTLSGFRSTYKAGAGLILGVAVLTGLGVDALAARAGRHQLRATGLRVGAVGVVLVSGLPFWVGDLYDPGATSGPIPEYWYDAARTINDLPGDGRLLVLPASTRTVYEWGYVGDDILDSLITRPQAVDVTIPLSTPEAADLLAAVSQGVADARYQPGALVPILRRLGIDHVLVRNDLDAAATRTLRPDQLSELRVDPGLERIDTFGPRGGTTGRDDLPALELFAVVDPGPTGPRLAPVEHPPVVSGSGAALPGLAASGVLDAAGPLRYSPDLDDDALVAALDDHGGRVILTDTNRRRVTVVNNFVRDESWTLAEGEDLDREGGALFDAPGSQTVAWYRDATRIASSGFPRSAEGGKPWNRPALAFDGDPDTSWRTVELADQEGITLRVELREPRALGGMALAPVETTGSAPRVTEVEVTSSDGSHRRVDLSDGATEVDLAAGPSSWFELEITEVTGTALGPVGFTEVAVEGLDLEEWIQLPDDLVRRGGDAPAVAAAVAAAPLTITMTRDRPEAPFPVEPNLRRRFRLGSEHRFTLRADVTPVAESDADALRSLVEGCDDTLLELDGERVGLTLADPEDEVLPGVATEVASCAPIDLGAGWHTLASDGSGLDRVVLDDAATIEAVDPPPGEVRVLRAGPDSQHLRVDAPEGGILITGESWDERWVATVDGDDLGAAAPYDTLGGWRLPAGQDMDVRLQLGPARGHRIALVVTLAGAVACLILVGRGAVATLRAPGRAPARARSSR